MSSQTLRVRKASRFREIGTMIQQGNRVCVNVITPGPMSGSAICKRTLSALSALLLREEVRVNSLDLIGPMIGDSEIKVDH